ncbi:DUF2326 domain-containing protein [Rhodococcus hoagii]|nr:DUF2326 domain-containing protein [Prescottella equi]NKS73869.1 DUF2326 domain-containing protein [Prescottella equi]NKZ91301.1 DUF2326 domain-containing protein [Prescottella equi]
MKLIRLYSNKPERFQDVHFRDGLSVVVAEIRQPQNRGKTVHNLGKSSIARLVDFCLLKGKHASFFLYKHPELFEGFVFFLEVQLENGTYLTIARSLESRKSVSLMSAPYDISDATSIPVEEWSHFGLGVAPAKRLLDGLFGFSVVSPYDYRDIMGYVLREQDDYGDVFHLRKFRGKHREWKPFLAHLLGLNAQLTVELYDEIDKATAVEAEITRGQGDDGASQDADVAKIEGIISIRSRELEELTRTLDTFDFTQADADANREIIERFESDIAKRNEEKYQLSQLLWRLDESLREESILFSPDQAAKLFAEAGIAFKGQIRRELSQLVEFNRAISEERREYLVQERQEVVDRLQAIDPELEGLQAERARLFSYLEGSDTIAKYREISERAIVLRADIETLSRQREALNQVVQLRQEKRQIEERKNQLQTAIELDVQACAEDSHGRYSEIQRYFDEIVHSVLDEHALLSVSVSSTGTLEFSADIVDSTGTRTSAARGFTVRKLLCIAFDLAILRSYRNEAFPRFAFHDGVFESLETRAKRRLIAVLREYAALGLQPIITTLDSDLPDPIDSNSFALSSDEVICTLSDEGADGRLFKMASF